MLAVYANVSILLNFTQSSMPLNDLFRAPAVTSYSSKILALAAVGQIQITLSQNGAPKWGQRSAGSSAKLHLRIVLPFVPLLG